ncbi:hypothetical protein GDI0767 [Gluconacetobacter diazotrophicus PA1 5]|uniref:Uncharacterized protein n=1 Tax=Gluconacetobacter diazotrophicus (strain ATCC 49037 / DSM 5601 / CCUG 37298 / CIP 103539 / LMG 7603 / PAl5) TaxID=272568 RepID=A9HAL6_GLUDA|nr:hypothetical protein GDI0767 [Gluconacetobacter diazotrophicus PA1 5]
MSGNPSPAIPVRWLKCAMVMAAPRFSGGRARRPSGGGSADAGGAGYEWPARPRTWPDAGGCDGQGGWGWTSSQGAGWCGRNCEPEPSSECLEPCLRRAAGLPGWPYAVLPGLMSEIRQGKGRPAVPLAPGAGSGDKTPCA